MVEDREILRAELTEKLNQGQADALMLMIEFLGIKGDDIFVLKGFAGTGKTFLVKRLIEYIVGKWSFKKIAITAPTNKAVQELIKRRQFKLGKSTTYQTIHSLLGLTEEITKDGKVVFKTKGKDNGQLSKIDVLIVDEVSMLQDDIFQLLKQHASKVKMIFMGDPAQIPPVGKDDSIPLKQSLSKRYEEGYTLYQIMRQTKGNPIIEASFKIRDNLKVAQPIPKLETVKGDDGCGIIYYDPRIDRDEFIYQLDEHFNSADFKDNPDYAKVIAWRNKTVATLNNHIRKAIYGAELMKIMPKERIIANKPIFDGETIIFNTSEEIEVMKYDITNKTVRFGGEQLTFKVYDCLVATETNKVPVNADRIRIVHESSEADYAEFLEKLKQRAIKLAGKNKSWIDYYDALKWPADIVYNYAITAHKAQGSTYENVFLMEDDLNANSNVVERNRIKYTSYSRASHKLHIYRTNP